MKLIRENPFIREPDSGFRRNDSLYRDTVDYSVLRIINYLPTGILPAYREFGHGAE